MFGFPEIAVGLAIATSALLAFKQPIHGLVEKIGSDDIYAGLKLLIATFIALPLLPNRALDPWGALNPYQLWLLVILISSLSLAGYIAVRWLGHGRGTAVTAVAGGLVSSTAVTLSFARRSREHPGARGGALLAGGVVLAWVVMFGRVVVEVAIVNRALLPALLVPIGSMGAAAGIGALWLLRGGAGAAASAGGDVPLQNPFSLSSAIRFALVFAAVLLIVALDADLLPGSRPLRRGGARRAHRRRRHHALDGELRRQGGVRGAGGSRIDRDRRAREHAAQVRNGDRARRAGPAPADPGRHGRDRRGGARGARARSGGLRR